MAVLVLWPEVGMEPQCGCVTPVCVQMGTFRSRSEQYFDLNLNHK